MVEPLCHLARSGNNFPPAERVQEYAQTYRAWEYAETYKAWKNNERSLFLSFHHHTLAALASTSTPKLTLRSETATGRRF